MLQYLTKTFETSRPFIKTVEEAIQEIKDKFQELIDAAEIIGINIDECIKGPEEAVNVLYNETIFGVQGCEKRHVNEVLQIVNSTINNFKDYNNRAIDLRYKWIYCFDNTLCQEAVVQIGNKLVQTTQSWVNETMLSWNYNIRRILNNMYICLSSHVPNESGNTILESAIACIQERRITLFRALLH